MSDPSNEENSLETMNLFNLFKRSTKKSNKKAVTKHKCDVCSKEFSSSGHLKAHKFVHLNIKPYSCEICSKSFAREVYLESHCRTHYKDDSNALNEEMYICDVYSKEFSRRDTFRKHILTHSATGARHKCDVCSKDFSKPSHLKVHKLTHLGIKPFSCEVCSKSFGRQDNLKSHSRTHYKDDFNDCNEEMYKCDVCSKEFSRKDSFRKHMLTHSDIKPFSCQICSKEFRRKDHLQKHFRSHSNKNTTFQSQTVSKTLSEQVNYTMDGQSADSTDTSEINNQTTDLSNLFTLTIKAGARHKCDVCSKDFLKPSDLKAHKLTHLDIKPFSCEVCSKSFGRQDHLKRHSRYHFKDEFNHSILTPEEMFKCDVCSKEFLRKKNLKNHMITHSGIKPFSCPVCSKAFGRNYDMQMHSRLHFKLSGLSETRNDSMPESISSEQYKCTWKDDSGVECGKWYMHQRHLESHTQTHLKLKLKFMDYKCDICSRNFTVKSVLRNHMLTHSGIKAFSCQVCSKTFGRQDHMKNHLRTHF